MQSGKKRNSTVSLSSQVNRGEVKTWNGLLMLISPLTTMLYAWSRYNSSRVVPIHPSTTPINSNVCLDVNKHATPGRDCFQGTVLTDVPLPHIPSSSSSSSIQGHGPLFCRWHSPRIPHNPAGLSLQVQMRSIHPAPSGPLIPSGLWVCVHICMLMCRWVMCNHIHLCAHRRLRRALC